MSQTIAPSLLNEFIASREADLLIKRYLDRERIQDMETRIEAVSMNVPKPEFAHKYE